MPRSHKQIPALDGIRGIAILVVLFDHTVYEINSSTAFSRGLSALFYTGWAGVDLFFVLSGFLITGILLKTKKSTNYLTSFYMRRFLRIFPIYYLTLIAVLLIVPHSSFLASWIPRTFKTQVSYFAYLQNIPAFWNGAWPGKNLLGHFWSLAVEEQFYIVWPLLVLLLSETGVLALSATILALAIPLRAAAIAHWGMFAGFFQLTTTRLDGLFIGAALAVILSKRLISIRTLAIVAAVSAGSLAFLYIAHPGALHNASMDSYVSTFGVTAFALLSGCLVALSQHDIPGLQRVLTFAPLRSLGKYSYGMYVFHPLIFMCVGMSLHKLFRYEDAPFPSLALALVYNAALMVLVYVTAWASYHLLESRFLALKHHFEPRYVADGGQLMAPDLTTPASANPEITRELGVRRASGSA